MIQAVSVIHASISQIANITYMSRKYLSKLMDKKGCKPSHEFFLFANRCVGIRTDVLEDDGRSSVLLTFESQTGINLSSKESFGTAKVTTQNLLGQCA